MVIFADFHKLLLYQKLNLGFECHICKRKFYDRLEHLQHTSSCKGEHLKCPECGKVFGHQQILQLHLRFHNLSKPRLSEIRAGNCEVKSEPVEPPASDHEGQLSHGSRERREAKSTTDEVKSLTENIPQTPCREESTVQSCSSSPIKILETPKKKSSHKTKEKSKPAKKRVGLTKVRMEDCLRCDACSCIYIDEKDYYKHMRNFHQLDVDNTPIPQPKSKRKCRSCCKQCRGARCSPVKRPRATQPASNLIFKINMRDNIKNRWTRMVSQQLSDCTVPEPEVIKPDPDSVYVKPDPDPGLDLSHLLSQVEVKIKTEPVDDYFV